METKKILSDGSIEGETFSGKDYTGDYPSPNWKKETYRQYHNRVKKLKEEQKFHLGDLSWHDWGIYCLGSPYNENGLQDEYIGGEE